MAQRHFAAWHRRRPRPAWPSRFAAIAGILTALALSSPATAAGFSCQAATTPRERLICGDPALSLADARLTAAYKAALEAVSEAGREAIRDGQRQWLRYTQTVCAAGGKAPAGALRRDCLADAYDGREKQLAAAVRRGGGLVIRRVDRFSAAPSASSQDSEPPRVNRVVISFPQIDGPRAPGQAAWNQRVAELARAATPPAGPQDDADLTVDYVLGSVSPEMISLWLSIYEDGHGAHGTGSEEHLNWLLREGRPLRAEDVFERGRSWGDRLAALVLEAATREARRSGFELPFSEASEILDEVSDPAHWLIADRELTIRFDDGGPGCCSIVEAAIPWRALRPYLRSTLPFAIAPD